MCQHLCKLDKHQRKMPNLWRGSFTSTNEIDHSSYNLCFSNNDIFKFFKSTNLWLYAEHLHYLRSFFPLIPQYSKLCSWLAETSCLWLIPLRMKRYIKTLSNIIFQYLQGPLWPGFSHWSQIKNIETKNRIYFHLFFL